MAFSEEYYLRAEGKQRGPYTLREIEHLYQKGFVAPETLYWRDGMEQWESVTDLLSATMQPRPPKRRMNWTIVGLVFVVALVLLWLLAPTLRDGWHEAYQREFKAEAAYWKARAFVREELRAKKATVTFAPFDPSAVNLTDGTFGTVTLSGTMFKLDGAPAPMQWHVSMAFRSRKKDWQFLGEN